ERDHRTRSYAGQPGCSRRCFVRERQTQRQGGRYVSAYLPDRERQPRDCRFDIHSFVDGRQWRSLLWGGVALADPCSLLLPFDLTRGGSLFGFRGHADIKEVALYLQDTITAGNWSFNLGVRGDIYRGISQDSQVEPRLGIAYNIKPSNTVLRVSY